MDNSHCVDTLAGDHSISRTSIGSFAQHLPVNVGSLDATDVRLKSERSLNGNSQLVVAVRINEVADSFLDPKEPIAQTGDTADRQRRGQCHPQSAQKNTN